MSTKLKTTLAVLMSIALIFGFLHLFFPSVKYNFERLHVFLFNLVSGGTILIYFTQKQKQLTKVAFLFSALALMYALFAFFEIYIPAMVISLFLAAIVESVRIKEFSVFPSGFFFKEEPVYRKFHQAALLCLSLGLVISCCVTLNNEYLKLISMPKLKLDTFFLGFSFPLSLITMSLIFSLMEEENLPIVHILKEIGFWTVNLGVIIFFLFIIFEKLIPQVIVTLMLFSAVIMILFLYIRLGATLQQKNFLTSGIGFLVVTAITGILYIIFELSPSYSPENYKWLLKLHSFASLYGWNLCGLSVICRYNDFPIQLHSRSVIGFHWITVLLIAPIGNYSRAFAVLGTICYAIVLGIILFSRQDKTRSNLN